MPEAPSATPRIRHMFPWHRNPLMRPVDRLEGLIRLAAVAAMVAAVPIAGALGTARYTAAQDEVRTENAAKAEVTATITGYPAWKPTAHGSYRARYEAPVRWNRDGRSGAATVEVSGNAQPYDRMSLWLTPDGHPTEPPLSGNTPALRGIGLGLGSLVVTWLWAGAAIIVAAWASGRRRAVRWERAWRRINPTIGQNGRAAG